MARSHILLLILIISIVQVSAQEHDLEEPADPKSPDFWNDPAQVPSASPSDVQQGLQAGALDSDALGALQTNQLTYGDNLNLVDDWGALNDQQLGNALEDISGASDVTVELSTGANGHADENGFTIDNADKLGVGNIILYDAVNVRWQNGVLSADSAGSFDYKGSTSTDAVKITANGQEFTVQKAAAVQAGCFLVEDVEIAKFVVNKNVTMTTSGDGKVVYGDGTKLNYDGLQANSSITGSVTNCMKPTYVVTAMQLSATTGNLTEHINGTGNVQVDSLYGVVCVNLSPVSTYDIDTGWYEENFGFVIRDYGYKLCVQKAVAQKLVADCPLCGLVDLANRKLLLNGVIEYRRYWHDSALIEQTKQTAFKSQGFGKNVIDLQRGTVTIEQDAPPVDTVLSNYLALHEHDADKTTHRYLGINEKINRVAFNWAKLYATEYAPATTTIINNLLDYQRGNCHVAVLPPNHPQISAMLSSLREQEVRFG